MPVYAKESSQYLDWALASLEVQTHPADEVVIVKDGPLGAALEAVIAAYAGRLPVVTVQLPCNVGLGVALGVGVERCQGELIARMDADDICVPHRLELQVSALVADPGLDAVGGTISEFVSDPASPVAYRRVPMANGHIASWAKSRNPLNHMTVMFRREAVLRAGNYQPFSDFEDYHLWVRMLANGCRFMNLTDVLVHARAGNAMLKKRQGFHYAATEIAFQWFLCYSGFISPPRSVWNALLRVPVRLVPCAVRQMIYKNWLRSH
jgi:glycosyltransferase involved in cell wall biosynthesis